MIENTSAAPTQTELVTASATSPTRTAIRLLRVVSVRAARVMRWFYNAEGPTSPQRTSPPLLTPEECVEYERKSAVWAARHRI